MSAFIDCTCEQRAAIKTDGARWMNAELEEAVLYSGMADAIKGARDVLVDATKCAPAPLICVCITFK